MSYATDVARIAEVLDGAKDDDRFCPGCKEVQEATHSNVFYCPTCRTPIVGVKQAKDELQLAKGWL